MVQIIIPMARSSIVTVILLRFLAFWNEYIISMTLLTKSEIKTLPVGLMNLMAAQKSAVQYGQMYAGLVIVMLPTLILYICAEAFDPGYDCWRTERLGCGRNERNDEKTSDRTCGFVVFVVCVGLVVVGQRNIGAPGLLTQLLGVADLVLLLWLYNRQYK